MSVQHAHFARLRTRWSAIGAAVAITLGAGGLSMAEAAIDTGDRPVTVSISAERILDTRTNLGLAGRFADATPRDLQVTGSVPVASGGNKTVVPADAIGVLVNVTVVTPSHGGFVSLRPQGAAGAPTTSTVNFTPGAIEPNGATVDLNAGAIQIWVELASDVGNADVLIDVVGYTIGHTHDDRYYTEGEVDAVTDPLDTRLTDLEAQVAPLVNSVAAFAGGNSITAIPGATDVVVQSVSLLPPADGIVVVNSSALVENTAGVVSWVRCSITASTAIDFGYQESVELEPGFVGEMGGTRGFDVTSGVLLTINHVCDAFTGNANVHDAALTAIFAPT